MIDYLFFFFNHKTAYEMRISDWRSDVCSSDLVDVDAIAAIGAAHARFGTTGFLPTLISDTPAQIAAALAAVDAAIEQGVPGVVGIHKIGRASCRERVCPYV